MKLVVGVMISFVVGAGCRFFDIPVPSPPVIPGALLVVAMTIGYTFTSKVLDRQGKFATTSRLCGGPNGAAAQNAGVGPQTMWAMVSNEQASQQKP